MAITHKCGNTNLRIGLEAPTTMTCLDCGVSVDIAQHQKINQLFHSSRKHMVTPRQFLLLTEWPYRDLADGT